jgi:hypothetical protein
MAAQMAVDTQAVMAEEANPGAKRSGDYLDSEALLMNRYWALISRIRSGRWMRA